MASKNYSMIEFQILRDDTDFTYSTKLVILYALRGSINVHMADSAYILREEGMCVLPVYSLYRVTCHSGGAALAMMVEILTGCLNGANCGYEAAPFMADDHLPPDLGQTFMAIDPEKCSGSFLAKVGSLAGVISSQDGARIPGERRFQQRRRNLREGIFIPDDLFRELVDLARQGRQI